MQVNFFLSCIAGLFVIARFLIDSYIPLIFVILSGFSYKIILEYSKKDIPEKSYGAHNSNAIMIIIASFVSLYKPGSFAIGILLIAISLIIALRIFLKPGGNPEKRILHGK